MTAQMSALLKMDMLKAGQGFRQENYRKGKVKSAQSRCANVSQKINKMLRFTTH